MSDRKEHAPIAAAEATRAKVMKAIRKQADEAVAQLMHNVSRLIDDAYRDIDRIPDPPIPDPPIPDPHVPDPPVPDPPVPDPPFPDPYASEAHPRRGDEAERERERRHLDAELRKLITDIVRAEIAALDVAALVKAEIDTQLRTITRLLQERLKTMAKPNLQKLSPLLSRRRR